MRLLLLLALLSALPAAAQVRTPGRGAVSEDAGPLGDDSGPVGAGSRSMYEGRTIGESSGRAFPDGDPGGGPVRDRRTRSMRSGPVSSMSSGPMTQPRTLPDGGSITESSAGAVKHDIDQPLGSRISRPLRELAPLQAQLREVREHGSAAAVAAAQAPVSAAPPPESASDEGQLPATEEDVAPEPVAETAPEPGEPFADRGPAAVAAENPAAAPVPPPAAAR